MLLILFIFLTLSGLSQPMLGADRNSVLNMIHDDFSLAILADGHTASNTPYISAGSKSGEVFKWFFMDGKVDQYMVIFDADDINTVISVFNRDYAKDEEYQWSDYSTGRRIYYHIVRIDKLYSAIVTYYDLDLAQFKGQ